MSRMGHALALYAPGSSASGRPCPFAPVLVASWHISLFVTPPSCRLAFRPAAGIDDMHVPADLAVNGRISIACAGLSPAAEGSTVTLLHPPAVSHAHRVFVVYWPSRAVSQNLPLLLRRPNRVRRPRIANPPLDRAINAM